MTVETTNAFNGPYVADGATTAFPFTFTPDDVNGVQVTIDDVVISSVLYTVALNDGNEGGTVNFLAAPTSGDIMILLNPSFEQEASWENSGPFLMRSFEQAFDDAAIRDIYLRDQLSRAVLAPIGQAGPSLADLVDTFQGNPGGNIMAIGLFTAAGGLTIDVGTNLVRTSGYSTTGIGVADYVYDAAVDAAYVAANPRTSFRTATGRGFKLSTAQIITGEMFGVTGLGVADDSAAVLAAVAWARANRLYGAGGLQYYGNGGSFPIILRGHIYMGATKLTIDHALPLRGFGSGVPGGAATQMRWDDGVDGIELAVGSAGYSIEGITLIGGFAGGNETTGNGIVVKDKGALRDIQIYNFSHDGVDMTTVGVNINGMVLDRITAYGCRRAFALDGADANAIETRGLQGLSCRQAALDESSFLGNAHYSYLFEGNARLTWNTGLANRPCSYCSQGGNKYAVVYGQEVWASTHAPTGTTASNQGWIYWDTGGVSTGIPAWFSGINLRAGGGILHWGVNSPTTFCAGYVEGDEFNQIDSLALVLHPLGAGPFCYGLVYDGGPAGSDVVQSYPPAMITTGVIAQHTVPGYMTIGKVLDVGLHYNVNGLQVVGARGAAVADAVNAAAAPTQAEFNALVTQFNALLARLRSTTGHGLFT